MKWLYHKLRLEYWSYISKAGATLNLVRGAGLDMEPSSVAIMDKTCSKPKYVCFIKHAAIFYASYVVNVSSMGKWGTRDLTHANVAAPFLAKSISWSTSDACVGTNS